MNVRVALLLWGLFLPLGLGAQPLPGTIEDKSNPLMAEIAAVHDALQVGADEAVIYYYRPDGRFTGWGFWLWALPGGDGAATWAKSQTLSVMGKVGYLRFKKDGSTLGAPVMGARGTGVIARDPNWTKDGRNDREVNLALSSEWVIFANDEKTYPYGPYRPTIDAAKLTAADRVQLDLSGRQALTLEPGDNGFQVTGGGQTYRVLDAVNTNAPTDRGNNYTRKVTLVLDRPADLTQPLSVSHPAYLAPLLVNTQPLAVKAAEAAVPPASYELGALYDVVGKAVEFRLWSPLASTVTVQIYRASLAAKPDWTLPLTLNAATGVWSLRFDAADPDGFFYDYRVTTGLGTRTVLDPWARAMDVFTGTGAGRGAVINPAKADPPGGWQGGTDYALAKRTDAVIYEVSVRDFTINANAGTKARPGSYLAFLEKLPYLKQLGVTHVQLLPVFNFYYTDETKTAFEATGTNSGNNYNWGYDPHNYFTPEGWYATSPADPYNRISELKTLIREIHKAGLGVLLDVVYNHTANTSILGDLVPGYFYRYNPDGSLLSNSGVGNDLATERVMTRRLISDSVESWVKDYHVDGFRFDLMGLMDVDTVLQTRARVAALPEKADVLFVGEGWQMYTGPKTMVPLDQKYMTKTNQVAVFNDELRDLLKGGGLDDRRKAFISDNPLNPKLLLSNLLGQPQLNYTTNDPGNNLQYAEAHDNLTMHDNLAFNLRLSDADPLQRAELAARLRLGNFFVLTSQGIAFLHAGQESGRTKPRLNATGDFIGDFVSNSYDSSDDINQFNWSPYPEYQALADYTAGLIRIRRAFDAFRLGDAKTISANATALAGSDFLSLGWRLKGTNGTFTLLVNASREVRTFDVGKALKGKPVLVDSLRADPAGVADPKGLTVAGNIVTVAPLTAILIKE